MNESGVVMDTDSIGYDLNYEYMGKIKANYWTRIKFDVGLYIKKNIIKLFSVLLCRLTFSFCDKKRGHS